mgnify:CR=1 FL=1|tara:strand:+ start:7551 stop:8924 length:1374 start_codon:yes stop_codon:yes gene_type:complete
MNDVHWNDLQPLKDILDDIVAPNTVVNNKDIEDFKESVCYIVDDVINNNIQMYSDKHFDELLFEIVLENVKKSYWEIINLFDFDVEGQVWDAIEIYFYKYNAFRSYSTTTVVNSPNNSKVKKLLTEYINTPQLEQRSKEWFEFRRSGLSASDIWKAIDSQSMQNSLIYSKCKPMNMKLSKSTNINTAFHNGHLFEPLSIMHYEYDFNTIVGEFGCMAHKNYPYLLASPDGINIKEGNDRYGRMVEVKNPTTRELTGIPKKEYWIQMQLQMEVWNFQECDFLETVFKQYETYQEFSADGDSFTRTSNNKRKGIIIRFYDGEQPIYKYPPVDLTKEEFNKWYDKTLDETNNLEFVCKIYWYLHDYSCVLVPRNKKWFNSVQPKLKSIWNTIEKERVEGYEHRKPKSKRKKKLTPTSLSKLEQNAKNLFATCDLIDSPTIDKNQNIVIKVRTESFDQKSN